MELYLDSANLDEISEAFGLGFLYGLTTTPTFMHRDGHTDIDATILKLADMVPVLQVEALGKTKSEIVKEAHRLLGLGLDELSVTPSSLPKIKSIIRSVSFKDAKEICNKALLYNSSEQIETFMKSVIEEQLAEQIF